MIDIFLDPKERYYEEREGVVETITPKAIKFFDDSSGVSEWVPKSLISPDWFFTDSGDDRGLSLDSLERNDEITLKLPRWFVQKEFLGIKRGKKR